jgi:hypothetical protein
MIIMNDLEMAKSHLRRRGLTLAIVKGGEVLFETRSHRLSGFLSAVENLGDQLASASLADKVAGNAVALLCVYAGISAVYAETLSCKAKTLLEKNGIHTEWQELVDNILNLNRSDMCLFEKTAEKMSNPKDAFKAFKALQESLKCNE